MIDTYVQTDSEVERLLLRAGREFGGCWILAQSFDAVAWGLYQPEGGLKWKGRVPAVQDIVELRAFAKTGELVVWRDGAALRTVWLRPDDKDCEEVTPKVWPNHLLRGARAEPDDTPGWTRITDARGASYAFPAAIGTTDLPLALELRYVLRPDPETGLARVVRSRLAGVIKAGGDPAK